MTMEDRCLDERLQQHFAAPLQIPCLNSWHLAERVQHEKQQRQIALVAFGSSLWLAAAVLLVMIFLEFALMRIALFLVLLLIMQGVGSGVFAWFVYHNVRREADNHG